MVKIVDLSVDRTQNDRFMRARSMSDRFMSDRFMNGSFMSPWTIHEWIIHGRTIHEWIKRKWIIHESIIHEWFIDERSQNRLVANRLRPVSDQSCDQSLRPVSSMGMGVAKRLVGTSFYKKEILKSLFYKTKCRPVVLQRPSPYYWLVAATGRTTGRWLVAIDLRPVDSEIFHQWIIHEWSIHEWSIYVWFTHGWFAHEWFIHEWFMGSWMIHSWIDRSWTDHSWIGPSWIDHSESYRRTNPRFSPFCNDTNKKKITGSRLWKTTKIK